MTAPTSPRARFRTRPRPARRLEVELLIGEAAPIRTLTYDIGLDGAFFALAAPPAAGTKLSVRIPGLDGQPPLVLAAEVRWVRREPLDEAGAGVQFSGGDAETRAALEQRLAATPATVET